MTYSEDNGPCSPVVIDRDERTRHRSIDRRQPTGARVPEKGRPRPSSLSLTLGPTKKNKHMSADRKKYNRKWKCSKLERGMVVWGWRRQLNSNSLVQRETKIDQKK